MIDMTFNNEDKKDFIVDIMVNSEGINISYANGEVCVEPIANLHNLEMYRYRMEKQALMHVKKFNDKVALEGLVVTARKFLIILFSIIGLFISYNFDISLLMKIIITILLLLGNLFSYVVHEYHLWKLCMISDEAMAIEYYLNNKDKFMYISDDGNSQSMLNIEEISQLNISYETIQKIAKQADEFKNNFGEDVQLSLSLKKRCDDVV